MAVAEQQRIALVIYSLRRDGAEKVVALLSQQFQRMGHAVTIIVFDSNTNSYAHDGQLLDLNLPSQQQATLSRKALTLIKRMFALRRVYRQQHYDKIIAVMESAAFPSILSGHPTIASNHCHPEIYFTRFEWLLARLLYPHAQQVVMVSKRSADCLHNRLKLRQLNCIYNPIDFEALTALTAEKPAITLSGAYLIAVARLEPQKRLDRLLNAYAQSRLQHSLRLLILGEGSLRPQLAQQIEALNLTGRVEMPGNIANPFPNIKAAQFLVLSSDHEGFPMVLIEALALGKPVVSTDCATGPNEIIRPGVNGMLVPLDDGDEVAALAAAMDELHEDQQQYRKFCTNARASVEHLAIERVAEQWLAL